MYFPNTRKQAENLKTIHYHIFKHAWGWCTVMTQRDVMGREVGGVHVWEHMYTRGGFMSMYGKTNTVCKVK